jgi:hypothetical protein
MLRSGDEWLVTDISGQPVDLIFIGQTKKKRCITFKKIDALIYTAAKA